MRVLLLNSTYEPITFLTEKRALKLLMNEKGKVDVIDTWDGVYVRTVSKKIEFPSILRLKEYVKFTYKKPRFMKYALFNRDNWLCQYCGVKLNRMTITIDHIIPRSKGGKRTWNNCVSSCKTCNRRKGNKNLEESGLTLRTNPTIPSRFHFWDLRISSEWNDNWEIYAGFSVK